MPSQRHEIDNLVRAVLPDDFTKLESGSSAWDRAVEAGLTGVGIAEELGGSGGSWLDVMDVARSIGALDTDLLVPETALARAFLAQHDGPTVAGPISIVRPVSRLGLSPGDTALHLRVDSTRTIAVLTQLNSSGEDEVWRASSSPANASDLGIRSTHLALARLAGCARRITEMTLEYADERVQFGRKLRQLPRVQDLLATCIGQSYLIAGAVASLWSESAVLSPTATAYAVLGVEGRAQRLFRAAHHVHGAIGFTREHPLHRFTSRLLTWSEQVNVADDWYLILAGRLQFEHPGIDVFDLVPRQLKEQPL